jgi:hypothetical protein
MNHNLVLTQTLKPFFLRSLNFAAEAATHKVYSEILSSRMSSSNQLPWPGSDTGYICNLEFLF